MIPKRIRERVVTAQFTAEQMSAVDKQCQDIVHFHIAGFSATKDIDSQMWALARDCYIQGLLDGNQVRPVVDAMTPACNVCGQHRIACGENTACPGRMPR